MEHGKVDRIKVGQDWRSRGYSCGLWVDPPGQVWEGYLHDVDELVMVMEGELELTMEGKTRRCRVGEEVFIHAHAVHDVRNIGKTTARWLYGYKSR